MLSLIVDSPLDVLGLSNDIWIVYIGGLKICKDHFRLIDVVFRDEPSLQYISLTCSCQCS